ncbi:hypothetical protein IFM89_010288 [Coptis chinensis]|uniref:Uncharacterized protein n=1 Tax=Coptis chinensis TaxID=261450 RepID=A0A835H481_9MAGN|nr:hypothetical protein IFM89_010288 [Coptis chinensis]
MSQTESDQPSDYQLDSEPSDSEEIEEQHESEEQHTGPKKKVWFNFNGLPVGPGSTQFDTFIGKMARMYCAPSYADWPIMPDDIKKHVFKRVIVVYDLSPTRRVDVLLKASISWKNWKHRLRKIKESPNGTVTRTHVFVATHSSKDGSCPFLELRPSLDEIKRLVSPDPYLGEKDLDNDPVAMVIGCDGKGHIRGLGTGVTKTVVHASAPYIKIVEEEKRKHEITDENVKLVMQRLDEETRACKILEEKLEGYAPEFENTSPQQYWSRYSERAVPGSSNDNAIPKASVKKAAPGASLPDALSIEANPLLLTETLFSGQPLN